MARAKVDFRGWRNKGIANRDLLSLIDVRCDLDRARIWGELKISTETARKKLKTREMILAACVDFLKGLNWGFTREVSKKFLEKLAKRRRKFKGTAFN